MNDSYLIQLRICRVDRHLKIIAYYYWFLVHTKNDSEPLSIVTNSIKSYGIETSRYLIRHQQPRFFGYIH